MIESSQQVLIEETSEMHSKHKKNLIIITVILGLTLSLWGCGSIPEKPDDYNPEDLILDGPPSYDVPPVDPHNGIFVNEHGTMTFNGDGESVVLDIDGNVARDTGLPEGTTEAGYYFYNPIEPVGYVCGYNEAHEMHFKIGEDDISVDVGQVSEDGSFHTGVDQITADRITIFGNGLDSYYDFVLTQSDTDEVNSLSESSVSDTDEGSKDQDPKEE
ncbi:MAG: hypothetical protein K6G83_05395 [Lachnospiraceae bacterium]|nr:hypothetical protein [Lachnospiraceae bacterium]